MGVVKQILEGKGTEIFTITPDTSVYHALELMVEKNVSALLVMENDKLAGIFTERDYARKVVLKGKKSTETQIGEIMTSNLITVSPSSTIDECMALMTGKYIRHLPVVADGKLAGIISIGDVVRRIIEDQKSIIGHMEQYIAGS
jgi:CBS domain-containing protein